MKKIGILGSGIVAKMLGSGLIKHGYSVTLGTRDTEKLSEWKSGEGKGAGVETFAEAAAFGEILILAVSGGVAKQALELADSKNLKGKTVMLLPKTGYLNFLQHWRNR